MNRNAMKLGAALLLGSTIFFGCGSGDTAKTSSSDSTVHTETTAKDTSKGLTPKGPKPEWGPSITDPMLVVMEKLQSYGAPPIESLSATEARKQPTPTTATMDVMKEAGITPPAPKSTKTDQMISVNGASLPVRIYTPNDGAATHPLIVYFHGGGWVIADLDTYDASAQGLSDGTGAVVVSVHYRPGPENKFPTAHMDAFAAYQWALQNAAALKVDPKKVALAGESAGGNLACNVSMMARDRGVQLPLAQLLVYPVASNDMNSESYQKYAAAKPLNKPMMEWFAKNYLKSMGEAADPRISLVNANLKGLPPTMIVGAEIDPLQTEGKLLADKLKGAGVATDYKLYNGVTHEFFGMAAVVPEAKDAQAAGSEFLKGHLK